MPSGPRARRALTEAARRGYRVAQQVRPRARATDGRTASSVCLELAELSDGGRGDEVRALIRREMGALSTDVAFLDLARQACSRAGEPTLQRELVLLQIAATPAAQGPVRARLHRALRSVEGRLRETDPAWAPTVPPEVLAAAAAEHASARSARGEDAPRRPAHLLKVALPQRQSGYSVRSRYSLAAQLEAGLDPVAITALDVAGDAPSPQDVHGVPHHRLVREATPDKEAYDEHLDAYAAALAPVLARTGADLLHVHSGGRGYDSALVGGAVARALGLPWVYEVRGFFEATWSPDPEHAEEAETYRRRRATDTRAMLAADAVVTLSESMRGDIVGRGVPAERVHVVPNGVDAQAFSPSERRPELVQRYGLEGRFVFGYVSNLDHYREAQELLVDAAMALRTNGVDATALVVGDGQRRAEVEAHAEAVGAGDAVVFTGRVPHDEVLDHYALMDVFVVPRVDEQAARLVTPLKPFEAMAAGLPLVVSDLPALTEIIGDGARGVPFAAGDAGALADVLAELHADPERRARLGVSGRRWVSAERSWSANGPRYQAVYDAVLRDR
ncbi:hypothetical protein AWH69_14510 [Janibacter melonis]|uniref:D-inositol 3-phosphate glycosyltransferase n=1 Tax=Janibacter melonis TaxID=262209 RepID=A0A176QA51_9MICO|nr:glycosyltransferase family 4 protein [Janibacter melonis]OAB86532.1 hypothetical protein AWH69_14510 [Janibacter melonis]